MAESSLRPAPPRPPAPWPSWVSEPAKQAPPTDTEFPISQSPLFSHLEGTPAHPKGPCQGTPPFAIAASPGPLRPHDKAGRATAPAQLWTPSSSRAHGPLGTGGGRTVSEGPGRRSLRPAPGRGHQTRPPGTLSPTEQLFSQGEKACWEEKLTQVGREPGPRGLLWGQRDGGVGSKPQWIGTCSALGEKGVRRKKGEPHFTDEQTGLQRGGEVTSSWGRFEPWLLDTWHGAGVQHIQGPSHPSGEPSP